MNLRRLLLCCPAVLLLAACSSSTTGRGTPPEPPAASAAPIAAGAGPCGYLTESEVSMFGPQVSYPGRQTHDDSFGPSCDYGGAVFTLVRPDVSTAAFTAETKPVSGVGDRAYYGSQWHWLRVVAGSTRFQLRCLLCSEPELSTMTAVARSVVPRLPG